MTKKEILSKIKGKKVYQVCSNNNFMKLRCLGHVRYITDGNYLHPFVLHIGKGVQAFNEEECIELISNNETVHDHSSPELRRCWTRYYLRG